MSWLFSRALVEAYSADNCSAGGLFAPLNVMPTPHKFWHRDKMTESWTLSRYGLTCAVLTESRGEALLTWYRAAFLARTSAPPEKGPASRENAPDYGKKWPGLFATFDRSLSSWKTVQYSLFEDSAEFSETWPRSGMTRNGNAYLRQKSAHPICATASGLWPTPTVFGNNNKKGASEKSGDGLATAVKRIPTPTASDAIRKGNFGRGESNPTLAGYANRWPTPSSSDATRSGTITENMTGQSLAQAVNTIERVPTPTASMMTIQDMEQAKYHSSKRPEYKTLHPGPIQQFPTPNTIDAKGGTRRAQDGKKKQTQLCHTVGGQLNPNWVEWLMGWPIGWTALEPLAMDKYQQWRQQHLGF